MGFEGQFQADLLYDNITGKDQNRPKWVRSSYFSGELTVPGLPPLDLKVRLSSLEESVRQYFDRFSVKGGNDWIDLRLGDVNPVYSKYSLNGILVRGGEIDLHPGRIRFAATYGRTKRAIASSAGSSASFKQDLYGFRAGYGEKNGSHADLIWVKIRDDAGSLGSTGTLKPQENLLTGLKARHVMFDRKLALTGELIGSAFTRDLNSAEVDISGHVPAFVRNLYAYRTSSQYDFAAYLESKISTGTGNGRVALSNIGPGFQSLGTSYTHNDLRELSSDWNQRFKNGGLVLKLSYALSRDNLKDQKRATTWTNSGLINMNLTGRTKPSFNLGYRFYKQGNDDDSSFAIDNINHALTAGIFRKIHLLAKTNDIKLNYLLSVYDDMRELSDNRRDYNLHQVDLSSSTQLDFPVTIIVGIGWSRRSFERGGGDENRWSFRLAAVNKALDDYLTTKAYFNYNTGEISGTTSGDKSSKITVGIKTAYRRHKTSLGLKTEFVDYGSDYAKADNYEELVIRLTFEQSFGSKKNLRGSQ